MLIVDHSKAALKNAMRELELGAGPSGSSNSQAYKVIRYNRHGVFYNLYSINILVFLIKR